MILFKKFRKLMLDLILLRFFKVCTILLAILYNGFLLIKFRLKKFKYMIVLSK